MILNQTHGALARHHVLARAFFLFAGQQTGPERHGTWPQKLHRWLSHSGGTVRSTNLSTLSVFVGMVTFPFATPDGLFPSLSLDLPCLLFFDGAIRPVFLCYRLGIVRGLQQFLSLRRATKDRQLPCGPVAFGMAISESVATSIALSPS
jgi:hypothetical protein